jgi:murein DD-endopeptidase MepM/ murein hydrolase activator NlpD
MLKKIFTFLFACFFYMQVSYSQSPVAPKTRSQCFGGVLCVTETQEGSEVEISIQNILGYPINVVFVAEFHNLRGEFTPYRGPLYDSKPLTVLKLSTSEQGAWRYQWQASYHMGVETVEHDDSVVYELPFNPGETYHLSQAFHGMFTHKDAERYAIDFEMPEGTMIRAARGGIVIGVIEDSTERGKTAKANHVLIRHDDGTIGNYSHLHYLGGYVKKGDVIKTGDFIGMSGNTGYSTGPHLHFHVATSVQGMIVAYKTFPIRFRTKEGPSEVLQGMTMYTRPD